MTQAELIYKIAVNNSITKVLAKQLLKDLSSIAAQELEENNEFILPGVAKLTLHEVKQRDGRNPQTGEAIVIPTKVKVKAKVLHPLNTLTFTI